jgi:hypothetical protein
MTIPLAKMAWTQFPATILVADSVIRDIPSFGKARGFISNKFVAETDKVLKPVKSLTDR